MVNTAGTTKSSNRRVCVHHTIFIVSHANVTHKNVNAVQYLTLLLFIFSFPART